MKKTILTIVALVLSLGLCAQNIVVQSFRLDETDLTANTAGTIVMDQNGQKCALIKVETTQTGFSFDTGLLQPQKVEQRVGEVWVYVPEGVKRITISHPQLGILRDHDLGLTVKRAKTYILKLTTGEVQTTIKQARTSQYVVFQLTPANAVVRLDGSLLSTTDGTAMKYMPFGTYDYMVEAPDYQSEAGKVTVNDPQNKHVVDVKLKPNFSQVTLTVDNNAEIWVNGEKRGNGSWTGNLGAGVYMLEARLAGHRPTQREATISVTQEPQTIRLDAPTPILGEASIVSSPAMADVAIDGKPVGKTPLVLSDLLIGQHTIKISKKGYDDYEDQLTVSEGKPVEKSATLSKSKYKESTTASETEPQKDKKKRPSTAYQKPSSFHLMAGAQVGQLMGVGATVGGYIKHVNLEAFYLYGLGHSEDIYWRKSSSDYYTCRYKTMAYGGKVGYGIDVLQTKRLRLTPQLGATLVSISADKSNGHALSLAVGLRTDYAFSKHFGAYLAPEMDFAVKKSDVFSQLTDVSSKIKHWGTGFNLRIGIRYSF